LQRHRSEPHPCPDSNSLQDHLLALASALRRPELTPGDALTYATELEGLAARATWANELMVRQMDLAWQLFEVFEQAGVLAHNSHHYALRAHQLLQGAKSATRPGEALEPLRPDSTGRYAWDRWQVCALATGLDKDLAGLGRAVMREAAQHDWNDELKAECGWGDAGQAMLQLARTDAAGAVARWTYLLETDGERGRWTADGGWEPL
jgi:hypothetical protein